MAQLTKAQIKDIDGFLERHHVKFVDARLELIDHLASEYETQLQEEKLHAFLMRKRDFIKDFVKNRQKKIHWSYQKKYWLQVASMFYKPEHIIYTLFIVGFIYLNYIFANKIVIKWSFIISIAAPIVTSLIKQLRKYKYKKIQAFQSIVGLMSFPSIFLYSSGQIIKYFPIGTLGFFIFWFITLLLGIAGLVLFNRLLEQTIANYNKIKRIY